MNWLFLVLAIVMVVLVVLTVEFLIPKAITALGNVDSWWSPFRILPPPGEMYILVRGDPDGPFHTVIESVVNHRYDHDAHTFEEDPTPFTENYLSHLGVTWVGFWRYFLWREVRYDKWEMTMDTQGKPTGNWGLVPKIRGVRGREGASPSIFFRYNMATEIKAAETIGNFPVDAIIVFTAQIKNPAQAFFFAGGWETQTAAAIQGVFREYVGSRNINALREELRAGADALVYRIRNLTHGTSLGLGDGLRELFGIDIVDARFVSFDLVTGDPTMTQAVRAKEAAILRAEARIEEAKGNREAARIEAEGIIAEYAARASQPDGAKYAMAKAIEVARPNVLGGGVIASVDAKRE